MIASAAIVPPDHNTPPTSPGHTVWPISSFNLPLIASVAFAGVLILRAVTEYRGSRRITTPGIAVRRDTREDYKRKPLAPPASDPVGFRVGVRSLSSLRQAIRMTDGSAQKKSRGVSMSPAEGISSQDTPAAEEDTRAEGLFDGSSRQNSEFLTMEGASWPGIPVGYDTDPDRTYGSRGDNSVASLGGGSSTMPDYTTPRHFLATSSAPPPFTPSPLSSGDFTYEERRPSYAVSIPPQLEGTFHPLSYPRQPHLNYPVPSSSSEAVASAPSSPPRRRSPPKSRPVPVPTTGAYSQPYQYATTDAMLPSSYPTSSPLLPPPPPEEFYYPSYDMPPAESYEFDGDGNVIPTQGELPHNHGWGRHTRVWGGGVCLACQASGEGYYGPNVPPEHRR